VQHIDGRSTYLQNILLKPGGEEAAVAALRALPLPPEVELLDAYIETGPGFTYRLATGEIGDTNDRRILTSLWAAPDGFIGTAAASDSWVEKVTLRRIEPDVVPTPATAGITKMVVLRRYKIQGDWDEFLEIWSQVAEMRERHDFHLTFAVSDREAREFTWAFTTELDDFAYFISEGQRDYYADPRRVELETINAYIEHITLTPARRLSAKDRFMGTTRSAN
jgi:hypothetical protein